MGYFFLDYDELFEIALNFKLQNRRPELISFLTNMDFETIDFDNWPYWLFGTMEYFKRQALEGSSLGLQIFNPNLLYPSKRLITDMSTFETTDL